MSRYYGKLHGPRNKCIISHCRLASRAVRGGMCLKHIAQVRNGRDPEVRTQYEKSERERFWEKVDKSGDCWIWTGSKYAQSGYGGFRSLEARPDGASIGAHRVAFFYEHGYLPSGQSDHIDHLCRNPPCVRPSHLEHVSNVENTLRGDGPTAVNARKTHCIHGHEFTVENTQFEGKNRHCKTCHKKVSTESARRRRARDRGEI